MAREPRVETDRGEALDLCVECPEGHRAQVYRGGRCASHHQKMVGRERSKHRRRRGEAPTFAAFERDDVPAEEGEEPAVVHRRGPIVVGDGDIGFAIDGLDVD